MKRVKITLRVAELKHAMEIIKSIKMGKFMGYDVKEYKNSYYATDHFTLLLNFAVPHADVKEFTHRVSKIMETKEDLNYAVEVKETLQSNAKYLHKSESYH